jgi:hypothetical protein
MNKIGGGWFNTSKSDKMGNKWKYITKFPAGEII